jgi:hypothetical protein
MQKNPVPIELEAGQLQSWCGLFFGDEKKLLASAGICTQYHQACNTLIMLPQLHILIYKNKCIT